MHQGPGLRVKDALLIAFVVIRRFLVHVEKERAAASCFRAAGRRDSDWSAQDYFLIVSNAESAVVLGESLIEPGRHIA